VNRLVAACLIAAAPLPLVAETAPRARNVIMMIPDGTSWEQFALARWKAGRPLATDGILRGAVATANYDSVITDSAGAGSAFATGVMTYTGAISVHPGADRLTGRPETPEAQQFRPAATVLEAARLSGRATGTVVTATFSTATNAVYVAHSTARSAGLDIAEQGAHQDLDVFFGGGWRDFVPEAQEGRRKDGADLMAELAARGVAVLRTRDEMLAHAGGPAFGFFAKNAMSPELDRPVSGPTEPSLAEMTAKAIGVLKADPEGFFLMVEGSQIDWGGHQNDVATVLHDHLAFDDAVRVALDFAKADGETLVIVAPDHNCGGMTIGNLSLYDQLPLTVEQLLEPVSAMGRTAMYVWEEMGIEDDPTVATVQKAVREAWGVEFSAAQAEEVLTLSKAEPRDEDYDGLGRVHARDFTAIGWTGNEHTGGDVPLFAFGPGAPSGLIAAPDLGRAVAAALGVDLAAATDRLFAPAETVFAGMTVTVDRTNPDDLVIRAEGQGKSAALPVNRNVMLVGDRTVALEGVAVFIDRNGRAWVPMQAAVELGLSAAPLPTVRLAAN
jgi:alkaline phosphatase